MKIFWAWQSDIEENISRHFIKNCLELAIEELNESAEFSDRVEIDHDTKNVPGSPSITDTIFEKIKECTIFVADITPVSQTTGKKIKKNMNPNVAIEIGYAIASVGDNKIISIMNSQFGSLDDLPFDIRHKRGPITYELANDSDKETIKKEEKKLVGILKHAISMQLSIESTTVPVPSTLDTYGPAIFYEDAKPLLRLNDWDSVKNKEYFAQHFSSYIYTKVMPYKKISVTKVKLKELMFDGNFKILPLYGHPHNTPDVNKYGVITINVEGENNINEFVQVFENGNIISVSNYTNNIIPLVFLKKIIERNLNECLNLLGNILNQDDKVQIEVGLVNNNNFCITLPNPLGNKVYLEPVRGPLEKEIYTINRKILLNENSEIHQIVKDLITSFFDDLGLKIDFDEHKWS